MCMQCIYKIYLWIHLYCMDVLCSLFRRMYMIMYVRLIINVQAYRPNYVCLYFFIIIFVYLPLMTNRK